MLETCLFVQRGYTACVNRAADFEKLPIYIPIYFEKSGKRNCKTIEKILASESMLGVTLSDTSSIPMGSIRKIRMFPLDFGSSII